MPGMADDGGAHPGGAPARAGGGETGTREDAVRLIPLRIEARPDPAGSRPTSAPVNGAVTRARLGSLEVTVELTRFGLDWSVANRDDVPIQVRSVALVMGLVDLVPPVRMFRHGYQSWSPSAVGVLGVDADPSRLADFEFLQAVHHADQRQARDGELRSEWVTLLADDRGGRGPGAATTLVGFDGGDEHDGTLRLRDDGEGVELTVEAFFGSTTLAPGERRTLHSVVVDEDPSRGGADKLTAWAASVGTAHGARTGAPYQVGWCSWYQYFHEVTEDDLRANLALAADWPFGLFQLDDGYQRAIGDWQATNARFPSELDELAGAIAAEGMEPGLWLAPFLVAPDSEVATRHPGWIARHTVDGADGGPLRTWWEPSWGGGEDGFMYGLDTTHPEVLTHLEHTAAALVEAGFTYLKLDFTFSPSVDGAYHDPSRTPAQRVRAGFDAIRRGAGEGAFLLGCGVPLANVVGVVDGNRIGPDVAPAWALSPADEIVRGYLDIQPSTQRAYVNTVTRSFLHRSLWLNDPDCLMLRGDDTDLGPEAVRTWSNTVAVSGGMALVSDDLALLSPADRHRLDEVIAIGREADAEASDGRPARCDDLLDRPLPTRFGAAGFGLTVDPGPGTSHLER